jgi:hypothetical protein
MTDQEAAIDMIRSLKTSDKFSQMTEDSKFAEVGGMVRLAAFMAAGAEAYRVQEMMKSGDSKYREILLAVYNKHNPAKLGDVEVIAKEWRGKEKELISNLEARYPGSAKTGESRRRNSTLCFPKYWFPDIVLWIHPAQQAEMQAQEWQINQLKMSYQSTRGVAKAISEAVAAI